MTTEDERAALEWWSHLPPTAVAPGLSWEATQMVVRKARRSLWVPYYYCHIGKI